MTQMQRAKKILNETFGYSDFRHNQAEIIDTIMENRQEIIAILEPCTDSD